MLGGLRHDRQRRRADAAPADHQGRRRERQPGLAARRRPSPRAVEVVSPQAAYIITDILAGNTDHERQPVLGRVRGLRQDGKRRPAAYKTGTTNDNRDVHAYGYLAPPQGQERAGPRGRRLDGQQQQRAEQRQPVARLVGAAVVGDPERGQLQARRSPTSRRPGGLDDRDRRRVHRPQARARSRRRRSRSCSSRARSRPERETIRVSPRDRRGVRAALARGLRRPEGHARASSTSPRSRATSRTGRRRTANWAARAARGAGDARRARGHPDAPTSTTARSRRSAESWGAPFAPTGKCPLAPPPCDVQRRSDPSDASRHRRRSRAPPRRPIPWRWRGDDDGNGAATPKPTETPKP